MSSRILLVEDEPGLVLTLSDLLSAEGYEVESAMDGPTGLVRAAREPFDLILLDVMLPGKNGFEVCRELRQQGKDVAILMLTAKTQLTDRVVGLKLGADDYLAKPFEPPELLARIEALLRRVKKEKLAKVLRFEFGNITVDLARRTVERRAGKQGSEALHLTPIEYKLLTHLASQPDRVITHQQLLKAVWGPGHAEDTHYVRVHMANLRMKVEDNASMPRHLLTEAGVGYRFVQ